MIRQVTAEQIRSALAKFDTELRSTPSWQGWEANGSYRYALADNGQRYPLKEIISIATGTPKAEFSGGEESVNFLREYGFAIEPLRLPPESRVRAALH